MATYNYLDKTGLGQVWGKIKNLIPHPDWNENSSSSPNYIANRTHWRENTNVTLVPQQTIEMEYDEETYAVYYGTANRDNPYDLSTGDEVTVNFGGADYTCTVTNNEGYLGLSSITTSDYTVSITIGYSDCYIDVGYSDGQSAPESISVSIVFSGYTYHTLDDGYLNGKLIKSGTGHLSDIFNDVDNNTASGSYSHAEGKTTTASGSYSHAEGQHTNATNYSSHAEGSSTTASGSYSHAEGENTSAEGYASHAEGKNNSASGSYSHAEGIGIIVQRRSQHAFGEYNIYDSNGTYTSDRGTYVEIVGNGTKNNSRSNARTLDWSGNEVLAGKLTVGTAPTNNMDVATKQYVDNATASITDEKLSTGTIGNNVYYPIVGDNTASATTKYIDSTGLKYDATSSTNGYARLYLGNGTASGTEGSKYGRLMIYGTTAYAVTLDSGSPTENRNISLPNKNGTVALTSDVPTKTSDLTNDSGFLTSHQSLANYVTLNSSQTISGTKTFDFEVKFNAGGGASDICSGIQCAFKTNRAQITNFFTQNVYTKTNDINFYKYSGISSQAPSSTTTLFTIKNSGTVSIGTTSNIPSITADNELTTKKYVDDAIPTGSSSTPQPLGTASAGSSSDFSKADHVHALPTLSISSNVITLTGATGQTTSITLPVYNGGVSSS